MIKLKLNYKFDNDCLLVVAEDTYLPLFRQVFFFEKLKLVFRFVEKFKFKILLNFKLLLVDLVINTIIFINKICLNFFCYFYNIDLIVR